MGNPLPQRLVAPQRPSHRTGCCIPPYGQDTVRTCTIICSSLCMCLYQHFSSTDYPPFTRFSWCGSKIKARDREHLLEGSQIVQSLHLDLSRPESQRRVLDADPGFDKRLRALNDHQVSTRSHPFTDTAATICNMRVSGHLHPGQSIPLLRSSVSMLPVHDSCSAQRRPSSRTAHGTFAPGQIV